MFRGLLVVLGMGLVAFCLPSAATAVSSGQDARLTEAPSKQIYGPTRSGDSNIQLARSASQSTDKAGSGKRRPAKNRTQEQTLIHKATVAPGGAPAGKTPQTGVLPREKSRPDPPIAEPAAYSPQARTSPGMEPKDPDQGLKSALEQPVGPAGTLGYLEIEVSHSQHTFKLIAHRGDSTQETLHECRVGLGGPGFPTPVGLYYVTHIYDDNPWWIPPKDRAWAAGDSPSKRVYGGTMAPLLKKRPVRVKKQQPSTDLEDMIAGQVQLDDYGYRFHGTNQLRSIGHNQSHGCVRMRPEDAAKVASLIKDYVTWHQRKESDNGSFVVLSAPVRLNLVK